MKKVLLLLALIIQLPIFAQPQSETNQMACKEYRQANDKLNKIYQIILTNYQASPLVTTKIKAAQDAWLNYRDAQLTAIYPEEDKQLNYGSAYNMCYCLEITKITEHRAQELQEWLNDQEGEMCAGSRGSVPS